MEVINIDKDSKIVISTQSKDIKININKCKAIITDISNSNKEIVINDGELDYCFIKKGCCDLDYSLNVNNGSCVLNVIDLESNSSKNNYTIQANNIYDEVELNIASVSNSNVIKEYYIGTKNNVSDTHVKVDCFGIVEDTSKLKYDITSFIKNGAKRSVVNQNSKILLFDKESIGVNNPVLEIEENDVKANHGSSIGMIDEETLFYLTSRGIKESVARSLVSMGKINYMIEKIKDEDIKKELLERV